MLVGPLVALVLLVAPAGSLGAPSKNYWLVSSTGQVFAYGKARTHGSEAGKHFKGQITGIRGTANGGGYWIVTTRTHYGFGNASHYKYRAGVLRRYQGRVKPRGLRGKIVGYAVATMPISKTGSGGTQPGTTTTPTTGVDCSHVAIQTSSLGQATAAERYSQMLTAAGVSGGSWSWAIRSGGLPTGLSLSGSGAIAGTPAPSAAGTQSTFTVEATNSQCASGPALKSFTLSVDVPPMTIATQSLGSATYGDAYSETLTATGGQPSDYQWSATGLPSGLSVSPTGVISGAPTTYGNYTVGITVSDSTGATPDVTEYLRLSIALPPLQITSPTSLSDGQATMGYSSVTFAATGGTAMEFPPQDRSAMYAWSAAGLPNGMSMSVGGVLSGTPTQNGTFDVAVTVADGSNNVPSLTQTYRLRIAYAPLAFTTTTLTAVQGQAFSGQVVMHGGEAPYSVSFVAGSLPAGMHFSNGTIFGTPTAASGSYTFTIGASDSQSVPETVQETFNLEIAPTEISPDLALSGSASGTIWAGYLEQSSTAFTAAYGTLTVPTVTADSSNSVSPWVGIDGYGTNSLIQAGVSAISGNNTTSYHVWWETLGPSGSAQDVAPQDQFDASPGDTINVYIWQLSAGQWEITVNDMTSGRGFRTSVSYTGADTTAEWIAETPSGSVATGYGATSTFSNLQTSQVGSGLLELSTPGAIPGSLTANGFSITDYN